MEQYWIQDTDRRQRKQKFSTENQNGELHGPHQIPGMNSGVGEW
jgi:hypothetical protein